LGPGPGYLNQNRQKNYLTFDITHKKTETQKQKNCLIRDSKTVENFGGLNNSLAVDWRVMELLSGAKIAVYAGILDTIYSYTGSKSGKHSFPQ